MRQDQDVTRKNLLAILKTLHTSDILGGIWAIRDYALNTFHDGKDPKGENENPIFKEAAEQFAYYEHSASEFDNMLADYTKLLEMFSAYLSTEGMIAEQAEITRIQSALAVQSARPEPAHAPSIPSTMRQDSSKPDINTSLITLRDSLKTVHPADIKSGVKALTRFMSEQMVIDNPVYDDAIFNKEPVSEEYPAILKAGLEIIAEFSSRRPWSKVHPADYSDFAFNLADYAKIAGAVHGWIFTLGELSGESAPDVPYGLIIECYDEIYRIGQNLGFEVYGFDEHKGVTPIFLDSIDMYLRETDLPEIVSRKVTSMAVAEPATLEPTKRTPSAAFNACAHFDETVKEYQTQAVTVLRGISERVTALARHCAEKITPDARQDALLFSERASHAAESISGK